LDCAIDCGVVAAANENINNAAEMILSPGFFILPYAIAPLNAGLRVADLIVRLLRFFISAVYLFTKLALKKKVHQRFLPAGRGV
jgi:hypothetical protein